MFFLSISSLKAGFALRGGGVPRNLDPFSIFFGGCTKNGRLACAGDFPKSQVLRQGMSFLQEMGVYGVYDSSDRLQYIGLSRLLLPGSTVKMPEKRELLRIETGMKQVLDEFRVECCK